MDQLTIDEFKEALPENHRKAVNPQLVAQINQKLSDPDMFDIYRENLLSYTSVMQQGKFKVSGYVDAVKYISLKLMGKLNKEAFALVFPDKIVKWKADGVAEKDIASYVTAYNKSKLVTLLYEQTLIPFWVINQDNYQKAINTQVDLMTNPQVSNKVRADAANSLLTHLKPPETKKIELDIGSKGTESALSALRAEVERITLAQSKGIDSGVFTAQQIAHHPLVIETTDAEFEEVSDE